MTWCSDGWRDYPTILAQIYHQRMPTERRGRPPLVVPAEVRLTQTVKHRDERGKLLCIEIRAALGDVVSYLGTTPQ